MPANANAFLFSPSFNLSKACLAAKLCQASYATTVASLDDLKAAIGASAYTVVSGSGLVPPAIVWNLAPSGYAVSWGGITHGRQFLAYLAASNMTTGATHFSKCSNFIQYCYAAQKAAILAAMGGGGASTPPINVFLTGHSAGGPCVQLLANDLITNYGTAFAVKGVYVFGSPKAGDRGFCGRIELNATGANFRHGRPGDPISTWQI